MARLSVLFAVTLVAYDALAATIARWLTISYSSFLVPALVILFFMGVYAGRTARSWAGVLPVAIAALADATLGWYVAALIGPGYVPGWTTRELIVMASESAALSVAVGCAGVAVGRRVAGAYFSSR